MLSIAFRKKVKTAFKLYEKPDKDLIINFIKKFEINSNQTTESANVDDTIRAHSLNDLISSVVEDKQLILASSETTILSEIETFEKLNILGPNLSMLKSILELVKPTSADCERVFSCGSYVYNEHRYSLSHSSLDCTMILKGFFKNL